MIAKIINGKKIAESIQNELAETIAKHREQGLPAPRLDVILVGDDPASAVYVRTKQAACAAVGIRSELHHLPSDISQQYLQDLIDTCNKEPDCHGILLQLPLPSHLNKNLLLESILPEKDVDGFHPFNMGRLAQGVPVLAPCTPRGVMTLLKSIPIELRGKDAVVVGASTIVGRPMALELLAAQCTVTICHKATVDLANKISGADILVVGIGNPTAIDAAWIKRGAVVIDVGFNRLEGGKIVGDIDFHSARKVASYITPVPGGVGPMTVATLLQNTWLAMKIQLGVG